MSGFQHANYKSQLPATLDVQHSVEVSFELVQACLVHPSKALLALDAAMLTNMCDV